MVNKKLGYDFIFISCLLYCSYLFGYFDIIDKIPNGFHLWRQSDSLSIAFKYYQENLSLWETEMHNRLSGEGKAVSEFPLMYYVISLLYRVFGPHIWVYRGFWIIVMFTGYFFLYRFCALFTKDKIWGILIALMTFSSPILVFYGASFIIDPIALAFVFVSWYFFYRFLLSKAYTYLWVSIIVGSLSSMMKITSLVSLLAISGTVMIDLIIKRIRWQIKTLEFVQKSIPVMVLLALPLTWIFIADYYNEQNQTTYFFMKIAPYWSLTELKIELVKDRLIWWMNDFLHSWALYVGALAIILVLIPFWNKYLGRKYYLFFLLAVIGMFSYFYLFYAQFDHHDYYFIVFLAMIPLSLSFCIRKYQPYLEKLLPWTRNILQLSFTVLLSFSLLNAKEKSNQRFEMNEKNFNPDLFELNDLLLESGIGKEDLILAPFDQSPNITLYALKRDGWSLLNSIQYKEIFEAKIKEGGEYVVIPEKRYHKDPYITPYLDSLVVEYNEIRIYSLK